MPRSRAPPPLGGEGVAGGDPVGVHGARINGFRSPAHFLQVARRVANVPLSLVVGCDARQSSWTGRCVMPGFGLDRRLRSPAATNVMSVEDLTPASVQRPFAYTPCGGCAVSMPGVIGARGACAAWWEATA